MSKRRSQQELAGISVKGRFGDSAHQLSIKENLANFNSSPLVKAGTSGGLVEYLSRELECQKQQLDLINENNATFLAQLDSKTPLESDAVLAAKICDVQNHLSQQIPSSRLQQSCPVLKTPLVNLSASETPGIEATISNDSSSDSSDDSSDDDGSSSDSSGPSVHRSVSVPRCQSSPDQSQNKTPMPMSDDQFLALVDQQRCHIPKSVINPVPKMTGPSLKQKQFNLASASPCSQPVFPAHQSPSVPSASDYSPDTVSKRSVDGKPSVPPSPRNTEMATGFPPPYGIPPVATPNSNRFGHSAGQSVVVSSDFTKSCGFNGSPLAAHLENLRQRDNGTVRANEVVVRDAEDANAIDICDISFSGSTIVDKSVPVSRSPTVSSSVPLQVNLCFSAADAGRRDPDSSCPL